MFNKTIVQESPRYPQSINTTIHEHRAPTDESVRLLNEMEEKAFANIVDRLSISGDTFAASAFLMNDPRRMDHFVCYKMTLNGKDFKGKIKLTEEWDRRAMVGALIREFSEIIALQVLTPLWSEMQR